MANSVFDRLRSALDRAGVAYTRRTHQPVYTSAEAAKVRGVSLHSGAKALVIKAGERFVMVVLPADLSLDGKRLKKCLSCKSTRFATVDEVNELTGLEPGAIPPFGSLFGLPTLCDRSLADNESINFNAGTHTDSLQMRHSDYIAFENPQIGNFARRPARKDDAP